MDSGRGSILSSKYRINPVSTTPSEGRSGDNFVSNPNAASLPHPASDVASCSHSYPPDLPGSTIPDCAAVHGVTSSDYHCSIDEDDIVIAVMGPTGAGKSSFVNKVAGREEAVIGYKLTSKTRAPQPIRCTYPDSRRNIVLVDTPGFDDTHLSDTQVLKITAEWLKSTYQNNIKLAGLLYLHRISDVRMAGTPLRNLAVFRDLCGNDNLKNIVLVTTMWDELEDQSVGSKREDELLSSFWKGMTDLGSQTFRYERTRESAWEIIDLLDLEGSRQGRTPLQIQQEMVDLKLPLHETAAAKTLFRFLAQLVEPFKRVWAKMRNRARPTNYPENPSGGLRRTAVLNMSSTSGSSGTSWSGVSLTDTASIASRDSGNPSSPAGSASTGCSSTGRQDALLAIINALRLAYQMADISSVPMLRGTIGTVLHIAQVIQGMGGTHHTIVQVVGNSGWLLDEITRHAAKSQLSRDMKRTLRSFQTELNNLKRVVTKIKERSTIARFFLYDADIQAIKACNTSIQGIYDKLGVKLAIDNRQAIARLEDQLTALRNSTASVCPFPRVSGASSDPCGSGNANATGTQSFMKNHGRTDSTPQPRANPGDYE